MSSTNSITSITAGTPIATIGFTSSTGGFIYNNNLDTYITGSISTSQYSNEENIDILSSMEHSMDDYCKDFFEMRFTYDTIKNILIDCNTNSFNTYNNNYSISYSSTFSRSLYCGLILLKKFISSKINDQEKLEKFLLSLIEDNIISKTNLIVLLSYSNISWFSDDFYRKTIDTSILYHNVNLSFLPKSFLKSLIEDKDILKKNVFFNYYLRCNKVCFLKFINILNNKEANFNDFKIKKSNSKNNKAKTMNYTCPSIDGNDLCDIFRMYISEGFSTDDLNSVTDVLEDYDHFPWDKISSLSYLPESYIADHLYKLDFKRDSLKNRKFTDSRILLYLELSSEQ